jgi:outer membrane protein OmpA-like peptidoglycan-associated protein
MKFAARLITTVALSFLFLPGPHADDAAKPTTDVPKGEPAFSGIVPPPAVQTDSVESSAAKFPESREPLSAEPPQAAGKAHGLGRSEHGFPRIEWFLGYSFWRAMPTSPSNRMGYLHGGSTSVALNFNRYLGIIADFGGYDNSRVTLFTPNSSRTVASNGDAFTYMIGPRLSFRKYEKVTPFVQVLFGGARASSVSISGCSGSASCTPLPSENVFATMMGTGLDIKLSRHVALRLIQGDFLLTHFGNATSTTGPVPTWEKNVRLSSGIVFLFGGSHPAPPQANRSPSASCSVDKSMVYLDSGDTAGVSVSAIDPDNDPLTYTWSASGGSVDGTGSQVHWLSTGAPVGSYTVTAHVDDGRGGTAACNADIHVEAKPNHPPTVACSAEPRSVFAGERTRITCNGSDPDGDPLTYIWRAAAGKITGLDASADFDTTGLSPETYAITTRVEDGRGGAADATTPVEVRAAPPPPQASKINECVFGKPLSARIDNVCKRILDDVALRLQSEPRASTVIIGYSDPKEDKPGQVAQDRATNAVKYLGEKGIDASRTTTRAGKGQAGAQTQDRRVDVIYVPEGATY